MTGARRTAFRAGAATFFAALLAATVAAILVFGAVLAGAAFHAFALAVEAGVAPSAVKYLERSLAPASRPARDRGHSKSPHSSGQGLGAGVQRTWSLAFGAFCAVAAYFGAAPVAMNLLRFLR